MEEGNGWGPFGGESSSPGGPKETPPVSDTDGAEVRLSSPGRCRRPRGGHSIS